MKIKHVIKKVLELIFWVIGIDAKFSQKDKNRKIIVFDQNQLAQYFYPNKRMELYFEGLERSDLKHTDNFSKQLRFYSLQQIIEHNLALKLNGDIAECGCWKGHSSFIIATLLSQNNFQYQFHIFDSFEGGLSEKTKKDQEDQYGLETFKEKEMFFSLEENVGKVLEKFNFIKLYKGWIPDRFEEVKGQKFSFVHIDVDLYEPTLNSLEFFYPRLVKKGSIIVDDYGFMQFPGCKKAVDEFLKRNEFTFFYEMPAGGCFIIK
jgi:O-methyltransferase